MCCLRGRSRATIDISEFRSIRFRSLRSEMFIETNPKHYFLAPLGASCYKDAPKGALVMKGKTVAIKIWLLRSPAASIAAAIVAAILILIFFWQKQPPQ